MKKIIYLGILMFFLPVSLLCETILSGRITEDKDNKPLAGVTVHTKNKKYGAISNENGRYSIKLPNGKYDIHFSYVGYETEVKKVEAKGAKVELNVSMKESEIQSEEVVVTGDKMITEMRKDPEPITIIDASEIRGRATSLESVLAKATGVKIRKSGGLGSSSRINIHGLEGKRIQLLLDDDPINSPDGNFTIDEIPIDLIERIEVYKGIVPARFGGDGIGGAVNIVIREFKDDYIDLSFQHGSYNTNRATWIFKKNLPEYGIEFGFGGFYNYADNNYEYELNGVTRTRDHDRFESYVIGLPVKFTNLWFDEIEIAFEAYFNNRQIQGMLEGLTKEVKHAEMGGSAILPNMGIEKEDFIIENLRFENDIAVYFLTMNSVDKYSEITMYPRNSNDKQTEIRNRLNLDYEISENHSINLNHSYRHSDYKPNDPLASEHTDINVTGFPSSLSSSILGLTYEARLLEDRLVNLTGVKLFNTNANVSSSDLINGITFQGTPYTKDTSYYSLGFSEAIRYRLTPWLNLKASFQHSVRVPTAIEIFGDGYLVSSNPDLTYEEGDNLNFGIFVDSYSIWPFYRFQFESNVFYSDITNYIQLSYGNTGYNYRNLGHVKIMGIDAEVKMDISENIYLHGNFTYQDIRDALKVRSDGLPNPTYDMRKPHIPWLFANFGGEYHRENVFFNNDYFKIFLESSYTHEFFYNWEMTKLNPRRVPTSLTHDAGIELALDNNNYIISFEVQNLTDEIVFNNFNQQLMGRAFFAKVRYTFMQSVHE